MGMTTEAALERLTLAVGTLQRSDQTWKLRRDYFDGDQALPYAPEGVNEEYETLRQQSLANWIKLAMLAPVQRLRVDGFRTGEDQQADRSTWQVWQANRFDSQQRLLYVNMMIHDLGIASVWPNLDRPDEPIMRVESSRFVHLERDPDDLQRIEWAAKIVTRRRREPTAIWTPSPVATTEEFGYVYDDDSWHRFKRESGSGMWRLDANSDRPAQGDHPLEGSPFVPYALNTDESGTPHPAIEPLIPQQDAINTIRFMTLLAMQFSAHRQRVFSGYDPVVRDANGQPLWRTQGDGITPLLGPDGQPLPVLRSPGRIGVDRALVFPGEKTKVYDLAESNLSNYIEVLTEFLGQFFATGQVPPQYLLTRMANLSGDALAGAESTLQALVADLKVAAGESHEELMRKGDRARGIRDGGGLASETIWADGEARSFAQTVDAIVKLISSGFPKRAAFEMIPGATIPKVDDWMNQLEREAESDPLNRQITDELARRRELQARQDAGTAGAAG